MKANRVIIVETNNVTPKVIENCEFDVNVSAIKLGNYHSYCSFLKIRDNGIVLNFEFSDMYSVRNTVFFHAGDLTIRIELDAN